MKIYRMHRGVRSAANYSGAMEARGRWNPPSTPVLYTGRHLSLACVEILVHLDKSRVSRRWKWGGRHSAGLLRQHSIATTTGVTEFATSTHPVNALFPAFSETPAGRAKMGLWSAWRTVLSGFATRRRAAGLKPLAISASISTS
jgi:RES domain-containing protein